MAKADKPQFITLKPTPSKELVDEFFGAITEGSTEAYIRTQAGDPAKQRELKATLPVMNTVHNLRELGDGLIVPFAFTRRLGRELWRELYDHEMIVCGGG